MPSPRVSVKNSLRYPNRPRVGTRNSSRIRLPIGVMETRSPLRWEILSITEPTEFSGTSAIMRSIGSQSLPSMVLFRTCGVDTWNS